MDSSVNASVMFPQLRLTPTRAAFARPGPHATAFPDVLAPMQPSDSLAPFGRRSGHPSPAAYPGAEVLFFTAAPVPPQTGATPETFLPRLPTSRLSPEEKRGDPRCLSHPLRACRGQRPRRVRTAPRPSRGAVAVAFRRPNTLGTRKHIPFVAAWPTAHSLACLRFAESVTVSGARLATGRAGSPFAGRVSHPLDDKQGFMKSSHTPFPLDQPCLVALAPELIIASECLPGEGAPHCRDTTPVFDTIARAETTRDRIGGFGRASAASEWLVRRADPIACRNV